MARAIDKRKQIDSGCYTIGIAASNTATYLAGTSYFGFRTYPVLDCESIHTRRSQRRDVFAPLLYAVLIDLQWNVSLRDERCRGGEADNFALVKLGLNIFVWLIEW